MPNRTCSFPGCDDPIPYAVNSNRRRCDLHGRPKSRRADIEAAVQSETDDCIIWLNRDGKRPTTTVDGRRMVASRAVWFLAHGDPGDQDVLHTCNGGSGDHGCINVRHLYLGTHTRNMLDKIAAGRSSRGTRNPVAILTEEAVRAIRSECRPGNEGMLATRYGVTVSAIRKVVERKNWAWLD